MLEHQRKSCILIPKSAGLPIAVHDARASLAYLCFKSRALCAAFFVNTGEI